MTSLRDWLYPEFFRPWGYSRRKDKVKQLREMLSIGYTKREQECIELVLNGLTNAEIGLQLFITEKTVKFHLTKVYKKLECDHNNPRQDLISYLEWKLEYSFIKGR